MVHGQPLQLVEVGADGQLIFHRHVLDTVVTLCGDLPLAIYTVAGEFRKGKTTLLNIFLAFNHFNELGKDWKQNKNFQLSGFEARGGSIKVTNGIWVWSKPFFSVDKAGKKVAIILLDTQGTFDQDTSSAVNSFIFGFSLSLSSILMYNNMKQISSHDVDSLITFGMTFIPIVGKFQTLSFLVRDWDDEERFPFGWEGGEMMINDLLNPGAGVDADLSETRKLIKDMHDRVTGFLLPLPGMSIERAKRTKVSIRDMDCDFEKYIDDLCQEIFVRNVKPFTHRGREIKGSDWLTIFDHLIVAYEEGRIMDPGFHQDAFTGSSSKTIKDEIVANYQKEMTAAIEAGKSSYGQQTYVSDLFFDVTESRIRQNAMKCFRERTEHFGRLDAIEAQMLEEVSTWSADRKRENERARIHSKKEFKVRLNLIIEQGKTARVYKGMTYQMDLLRRDTEAKIEQMMARNRERLDKIRRKSNQRMNRMMNQ